MDWSKGWSLQHTEVVPAYIFNEFSRQAGSIRLDQLNTRNILRWWNAKWARRDGPFMNAMTQLVYELRCGSLTFVALIWTKAHSRSLSALSIGNKAVDALALKGRQLPLACSSPSLSPPSPRQRHGRRGASVTSPPPRTRRRLDSCVPPHSAFHLSDSPIDTIPSKLFRLLLPLTVVI